MQYYVRVIDFISDRRKSSNFIIIKINATVFLSLPVFLILSCSSSRVSTSTINPVLSLSYLFYSILFYSILFYSFYSILFYSIYPILSSPPGLVLFLTHSVLFLSYSVLLLSYAHSWRSDLSVVSCPFQAVFTVPLLLVVSCLYSICSVLFLYRMMRHKPTIMVDEL